MGGATAVGELCKWSNETTVLLIFFFQKPCHVIRFKSRYKACIERDSRLVTESDEKWERMYAGVRVMGYM